MIPDTYFLQVLKARRDVARQSLRQDLRQNQAELESDWRFVELRLIRQLFQLYRSQGVTIPNLNQSE